jgi:hypothetical protein
VTPSMLMTEQAGEASGTNNFAFCTSEVCHESGSGRGSDVHSRDVQNRKPPVGADGGKDSGLGDQIQDTPERPDSRRIELARKETWQERHNRQARESYGRHRPKKLDRYKAKAKSRLELKAAEAQGKLGREPRTLAEWWTVQTRFMHLSEFAAEMGVRSRSTIHIWFRGKKEPEHKYRKKLFAITGLPCFAGFESFPAKVPSDLPQSFTELLPAVDEYISALHISQDQNGILFRFFIRSFQELAKNRCAAPNEITPSALFESLPMNWVNPRSGGRTLRWGLGHFGTFLGRSGYWTPQVAGRWPGQLRTLRRTLALSSRVAPAVVLQSIRGNAKKKRRPGRPIEKREMFATAGKLHQQGLSWPRIAQQLTPEAFREDPRKAADALRKGVGRLRT